MKDVDIFLFFLQQPISKLQTLHAVYRAFAHITQKRTISIKINGNSLGNILYIYKSYLRPGIQILSRYDERINLMWVRIIDKATNIYIAKYQPN